MAGQRVGYVRVSTYDQNPERQLEDIELDCIPDEKFEAITSYGKKYYPEIKKI